MNKFFCFACRIFLLTCFLISCSNSNRARLSEPMPENLTRDMAQAWQEAGKPSQGHRRLEAIAGKWTAEVRFWAEPNKPPEVSKAKADHIWILDGRFIQEDYQGEAMGKPFQGLGLIGYDNIKKEYVSVWTDSTTTTLMFSAGQFDDRGKVLTLTGSFDDPYTGETRQTKSVTRIVSDKRHIFEMFETDSEGNEVKNLEIIYTRR